MRKFGEIIRFELRFQSRKVANYLYFLILFGVSIAVMSTGSANVGGRENVYANAPFAICFAGTLITLICGFFLYAITGTAIYRDFEARVHDLFFTTGISRSDYYLGRFLGSYLISLLVFTAVPLGMALGSVVHVHDATKFGPFHADAFAVLYFDFIVPDVFLVCALSFVWGALTRSLTAIYAQGILLASLWLFASNNATQKAHGALYEPFGAAAQAIVVRYWTLNELNSRRFALTGDLLANRLVWMGVGLAVLLIGFALFDLAHRPRSILPERRKRSDTGSPLLGAGTAGPRQSPPDGLLQFRSFLRLTALYTVRVLRSVPFILIVLTGALLLIATASDTLKNDGIPIFPVTRIMADNIDSTSSVVLLCLIAFYAGELIWWERVEHADQMVDTLPIHSSTFLLAKAAALLLLCFVSQAVAILTGIGIQIFCGYYRFELPLYLLWLFVLNLPWMLCVIFLALFLHLLTGHRFFAIACLALAFGLKSGLQYLGFERELYLLDGGTDLTYSDMNGFGPYLWSSLCWGAYWLAISTLFLIAALHMPLRGAEITLRARWRNLRFGPAARIATGMALVLFLGIGVYNTYNTDVLNTYQSSKGITRISAGYERDYKAAWEHKPMPRITAASLDISLYPERRQYAVHGTFQLKNRTAQPIREIALDVNSDWDCRRLDFGGGARQEHADTRAGFYIYALSHPLAPGGETTLDFDIAYRKSGFTNGDPETDIAGNGTFLTNVAPHIGYQPENEVSDPNKREDNDLPVRPVMAPATDVAARANTYITNDADWMSFDATIRTAPDQIALAPGYLKREWTENGRRCFRYVMDAPMQNFYSIQSARYAVKRDVWISPEKKRVALEIYYHPAHSYNLNRMMRGMKASLDYCSANFSPYQFRQLRIVESPIYGDYAQSFANTIPYSEGIGFIADVKDEDSDIDYPFYVSAHETAHQWWGHQLQGANVAGSEVLSESLAEYSALMSLQKAYGRDYVRRYLKNDMDEYLTGRSADAGNENPLVSAQHQQYLHYNKGALAFCALADRMGETQLNQRLSQFLYEKRYHGPPYPTAPELVACLKDGADPSLRAFISDLFEHITMYSLTMHSATVTKEKGGKYHVTTDVSFAKYYEDSEGHQTLEPLNDRFTVGFFARPESGAPTADNPGALTARRQFAVSTNPSYLAKGGGRSKVSFDLDFRPGRVEIDPDHRMLDRDFANHAVNTTGAQ